METSLYGDQDYTAADYHTGYFHPMDNMHQLKKRMTLDLDVRPAKRQRGVDPLLTSPDVNMLKLASPDLERFITQHGLATTPTPGQTLNTVFSRPVTEEQENYARGFVDALHHLKQQEQQTGLYGEMAYNPAGVCSSNETSPVYTQLEPTAGAVTSTAVTSLPGAGYCPLPFEGVSIKEEPQTVPSLGSPQSQLAGSQPPSPVDMDEQEVIKLERKRLRNRIAATKCRKRKLERIARLEDRVRQIKSENSELAAVAARLRDQVMGLKKEALQHEQNGCQILAPR